MCIVMDPVHTCDSGVHFKIKEKPYLLSLLVNILFTHCSLSFFFLSSFFNNYTGGIDALFVLNCILIEFQMRRRLLLSGSLTMLTLGAVQYQILPLRMPMIVISQTNSLFFSDLQPCLSKKCVTHLCQHD